MKKLTKILLINWLYYEKQLILLDDINFLTGKNSSGKSTFIDALQVVLLGEIGGHIFNKAANESSKRTLKGYLRADMDGNNPRSRRGRSFSSYIVCQFDDDMEGKVFSIGVVFDCDADGREREQFFSYEGPIPDDCFISGRQSLEISQLRALLKSQYKGRAEFYDSNKKYREAIAARWNLHSGRVFTMLKKAVSFKPIVNIQDFITDNICEVPDRPDVLAMQQNIRDYKQQELLAKRQEDKQKELTAISELFRQSERNMDIYQVHRYLVARAGKELADQAVAKLEQELTESRLHIAELTEQEHTLGQKLQQLGERRDQLIRDRANSDVYQEQDRLEGLQTQLQAEIDDKKSLLDKTCDNIRVEVMRWLSFCGKLAVLPSPQSEKIADLYAGANSLVPLLKTVEKIGFKQLDGSTSLLFSQLQASLHTFRERLYEVIYHLERTLRQQQEQHDSNLAALQKLSRGIKDYRPELLELKGAMEQALSQRFGTAAQVHILADLLEITDEKWQGAVEGYLNTQRFYLLVAPEHYSVALGVLDRAKRTQRLHGYGLVDVKKLRESEKLLPNANSLATVVTTDNELARDYITYLLGRVTRCEQSEELRRHRVAITPQGMLYQGYVSRPISPALMEDVYIGKRAVEQRVAALEAAQRSLEQEIPTTQHLVELLSAQKDREPLFTLRYVEELTDTLPAVYRRMLEATAERDMAMDKLGKLDLTWLMQLTKQLKSVDGEISEANAHKKLCSESMGGYTERIKKLEYDILPEKCQERQAREDVIADDFSEHYVCTVGQPRYDEQLSRLKSAGSILRNFTENGQVTKSKNAYDESRRKLVYARRDYVNHYPPCAYHPDAMDNEDFDSELKLLSEVRLPEYREKIRKARESALEQFQNDFLSKLKSNIDTVRAQVNDLNKALKLSEFGGERYRFMVERSPDYAEYYDMIMAPELMEEGGGLFSIPFQNKFGALIDSLFSLIVSSDEQALNARKQNELQQNIERFTDYRTYLRFDLETTDSNGSVQMLSHTLNTKSGGETQTPFYVAVLASFAQIYKVSDGGAYGNTMRLVLFDEAFNKMDSERIVESVRLLRKMNLQAIICTPPDKLPDIMPEADTTLLVYKDKYQMQIVPWSKELEGLLDE